MCLLLVSYGMSTDAVAVIGANREEAYERGGAPPGLQRGRRPFVGGIDPRAGGTWLGINDCGVLVAITNRPDRLIPQQARSRGLLARDVLGMRSSAEAAALAAAELTTGHYGGCNVVLLDASSGHVVSAAESVRSDAIRPGIHGLTNGNVDDKSDRRISYALQKLGESDLSSAEQAARVFRTICSSALPGAPPMCIHRQEGGTVSSSVIVLRTPVAGSEIWHCQGSPDSRPYKNCSHLFCELGQPLTRAIR
jgi:uncharacterized protein with NRDE domain